jgi:hypothetical protein
MRSYKDLKRHMRTQMIEFKATLINLSIVNLRLKHLFIDLGFPLQLYSVSRRRAKTYNLIHRSCMRTRERCHMIYISCGGQAQQNGSSPCTEHCICKRSQ